MAMNALQAVLDKAAHEPATPVASKARAARVTAPPKPKAADEKFYRQSRDGRKFVGGHFDPRIAKQLRLLAAEDDTTTQALLEEALDGLFIKKGRAAVAELLRETKVVGR